MIGPDDSHPRVEYHPGMNNQAGNMHTSNWSGRAADWLLYPVLILTSLGGVAHGLQAGYAPGLVLFVQSVASIVVIATLEVLRPLRADWALFSDRTLFGDLIHNLMGQILAGNLGRALLAATIALVAAYIAGGANERFGLWPESLPFVIGFGAFLLYMELASYWWHRALHVVPLLWRFHYIHHNPRRMHVMKSGRTHWGSGIIGTMLKYALPVATGAPGEFFLWYAACTNIFGTLSHANLGFRVPAFVHYVVNTAAVHHLHHSTRMDQGNSNFGNIISLWDVIFGTFRHPDTNELEAVGVKVPVLGESLAAELIEPVLPPRWTRDRKEHTAVASGN